MPALKEKAISLLGSVTFGFGASGAAGTATAFIVPTGKIARATHITVFRTTSNLASAVTAVNFGSFYNNGAATSLASMTATTNTMTIWSSAIGNQASAGQAWTIQSSSGAGAVSATFNVWGFLDNT